MRNPFGRTQALNAQPSALAERAAAIAERAKPNASGPSHASYSEPGVIVVPAPADPLALAVVKRLAPAVRVKLEALQIEAAAIRAAALGFSDEVTELRRQKHELENALRAHEMHPLQFRSQEEDERVLPPLRAQIARARRAIERQEEARDERHRRAAEMRSLLGSVVGYADRYADDLRPYRGKNPAPSGDPRRVVDAARRRIEGLRSDRRQIAAAPIPAAEAKQRIAAEITALAERGRPDVTPILERHGEIEWPRVLLETHDGYHSSPDALGVFAWLNREQLIAALCGEVDELADDSMALSDADRARRLAEVDAEILAAERAEEAAIEAAAERGTTIDRRGDADPRAVLALADDMPAPKGG